tara:strand:- start:161 stop:631 length:471 start_codon:yes stop_codon:yes gene_type:complete
MFTTVDSERKKSKHSITQDASGASIKDAKEEQQSFLNNFFDSFFSIKDNYLKIQVIIFLITLLLSIVLSVLTTICISVSFGLSFFIGSVFGILYLRLLAKSIANLGKSSTGVSKIQLLLPVCLFIFTSKSEFLEILPAIIGFFLYKPAIVFYFSRS